MTDRPPPGTGIAYATLIMVVVYTILGVAWALGETYTVSRDDQGGLVRDRAAEVAQLRHSKTRVEIRASRCLSSCTMYLGAGDVCVNPNTTFGFHGPKIATQGLRLLPSKFEYWSHLIASHYPVPLRRWYLSTGRYRSSGYYRIKGSNIIELGGFDECGPEIVGE